MKVKHSHLLWQIFFLRGLCKMIDIAVNIIPVNVKSTMDYASFKAAVGLLLICNNAHLPMSVIPQLVWLWVQVCINVSLLKKQNKNKNNILPLQNRSFIYFVYSFLNPWRIYSTLLSHVSHTDRKVVLSLGVRANSTSHLTCPLFCWILWPGGEITAHKSLRTWPVTQGAVASF